MAKKSTKVVFSRATITFENGKYTITEITKDNSTDYNLSAVLDSFVGLEGISLSISADDDVPAVTEE